MQRIFVLTVLLCVASVQGSPRLDMKDLGMRGEPAAEVMPRRSLKQDGEEYDPPCDESGCCREPLHCWEKKRPSDPGYTPVCITDYILREYFSYGYDMRAVACESEGEEEQAGQESYDTRAGRDRRGERDYWGYKRDSRLDHGRENPTLDSAWRWRDQAASGEPQKPTYPTNGTDEQEVATPDDALAKLLAGNEKFLAGASKHPHQTMEHLKTLSDSQKPFAAVLGCSDSRVPPEILFDQGFGDLFVCRVAGNVATTEQIASLEYAVVHLKIKLIVILGHAKCGACSAALSDIIKPAGQHAGDHELEGHLDVLVNHLAVAVERAEDHEHEHADLDQVVRENVIYQVERLSKAPVISEALKTGKIKIVGGYYDLDTWKVSIIAQ